VKETVSDEVRVDQWRVHSIYNMQLPEINRRLFVFRDTRIVENSLSRNVERRAKYPFVLDHSIVIATSGISRVRYSIRYSTEHSNSKKLNLHSSNCHTSVAYNVKESFKKSWIRIWMSS